jgi:hypothetical protein
MLTTHTPTHVPKNNHKKKEFKTRSGDEQEKKKRAGKKNQSSTAKYSDNNHFFLIKMIKCAVLTSREKETSRGKKSEFHRQILGAHARTRESLYILTHL